MYLGLCLKKSFVSCCDYFWCGIFVLVIVFIGEIVDLVVEREGVFLVEEVFWICYDCLLVLWSVSLIGI